jgi:hypothetical protein
MRAGISRGSKQKKIESFGENNKTHGSVHNRVAGAIPEAGPSLFGLAIAVLRAPAYVKQSTFSDTFSHCLMCSIKSGGGAAKSCC